MDPLVAYLKANPLPKTTCRPNISADAVETITLGMVQARGSTTCGISEATTHDKFQLMKLTLALLSDTDISGLPPACFTSVAMNSNFACKLHVDKHNEGLSNIVGGGDYIGGEFCLRPNVPAESSDATDAKININKTWFAFDGATPHETLPFEGFRISVVFFSVPLCKCDCGDLAVLRSLGFPVPNPFAFGELSWPYHIYICSAGRS